MANTATPPLVITAGQIRQLQSGQSLSLPFNSYAAVVDFGTLASAGNVTQTVTGQTWVSSSMRFIASFFGTTTDHDAEDANLEELKVCVANVVDGVGFDIVAFAPNSTWGRYNVHVMAF